MRKSVWLLLTAITASTVLLAVACGDDDDNPVVTPIDGGRDTGPVVTPPTPDTGPPVTPPDSGIDSGPQGCTFASYVSDLIKTQTTAAAVPTADLGDKCTPTTSQDDFKPLFP